MRRADAPAPGWYPDPTGGPRLRWWDGLDWTDHRRPPPTAGLERVAETVRAAADRAADELADPGTARRTLAEGRRAATRTRDETAEIMAEVRKAARDEVDRAVHLVSDRARDATRGLEGIVSQYGDRVMRWIRNLGIVAIVLVVLWMVLQTVGQASLLDWIGDRIDNVFDGDAAAAIGLDARPGHTVPAPSAP